MNYEDDDCMLTRIMREAAPKIKPRRFRIRRCDGNKSAWMLCMLKNDGTEYDSFGTYKTSTSLDLLLKHAGHLTPRRGEYVELVMPYVRRELEAK